LWSSDKNYKPLGRYTATQWQHIEKSLTAMGVDPEKFTIGGPFNPREHWWLSPFWPRSLYDALTEMG
jgi:hypothetical protein